MSPPASTDLEREVDSSRFIVEATVAVGGMGTILRALDLQTGKRVALKLLHSAMAEDRFLREARILTELRHPNIVPYVAHGRTENGHLFLAMEWMEGCDLFQRLRQSGLTLHESLTLARVVGEGLCFAHRQGIIHRDIKPSNLFLRDGQIERTTLLDFGIAHTDVSSDLMTRTGQVIGTPQYMAPEQARGMRGVGPRADLFALGCVLYECVAGVPPFRGTDLAQVLAQLLFVDPPPLRTLRPELPLAVDALDVLLRRMLAKDPQQRIQDADTLIVELDALLALLPEHSAGLPRAPETAAPSSREHQLLSMILAVPADGCVLDEFPTINLSTEAAAAAGSCAAGERADLDVALQKLAVRLLPLDDGVLVAALQHRDTGSAIDRAAQGARAARLVKDRYPRHTVVLCTGRGKIVQGLPDGEVRQRALEMVSAEGARPASPQQADDIVLVDEVTAGLLSDQFLIEKGASGTLCLSGERASIDESRPLLGKPTPCVGRDRELSLLDGLFLECKEEGVARAALVIAGPGMGKSRLRHEFLRRLTARDEAVQVLFGRGDPMSAGTPYALLGQALRRLCGIKDSEELPERQRKLSQRIGQRVAASDAGRVVAFIGEISGVPFSDEGDPSLRAARRDPQLLSQQASQAWLDFLCAEVHAQPLLIVLEDLHWGDPPTVRLVDAALRELAACPLMVLALARPDVKASLPGLWAGRGVQEIQLLSLGRKACERLIGQALGPKVDAAVCERIIAQAAGNALFLEELIRAVAEDKGDALPDTVLAMLQARLYRLQPAARRVLCAASIFGETFFGGGVAELLDGETDRLELASWLRLLSSEEMINLQKDSRFAGEEQYVFHHALLREAAYSLIIDGDCQRFHRLAGSFLERAGERDPMILAEHAQRGAQRDRATSYFAQAVKQAFEKDDLTTAVLRAERVEQYGAQGPALGTALAYKAAVLYWMRELEQGNQCAEQALPLVPPGSTAWCHAMMAAVSWAVEHHEHFDALRATFLRTDPEREARATYLTTAGMLCRRTTSMRGPEAARPFLERIQQFGDAAVSAEPVVHSWYKTAQADYLRASTPDPWRQLRLAEEAGQIAREANSERDLHVANISLGEAYGEAGDFAQGEACLRDTIARAERVRGRFPMIITVAKMHLAMLLCGRQEASARQEALVLAQELGQLPGLNLGYVGWAKLVIARVQLQDGRLAQAEASVRSALHALQAAPVRRVLALAALIESLVEQGRLSDASDTAREGQGLIESLGGKAGYAELPFDLAVAHLRQQSGDVQGAQEILRRARRDLLSRADRSPDAAAGERFLNQISEHRRLRALCRQLLPTEE